MSQRPELTGGGLVRSMGGWAAVKALRKTKAFMKYDERILGDSDFADDIPLPRYFVWLCYFSCLQSLENYLVFLALILISPDAFSRQDKRLTFMDKP